MRNNCTQFACLDTKRSHGEWIGLARVRSKGLRSCNQLLVSYVELMCKIDLQVRLNLTKKSRHVTRHRPSLDRIEQTMRKLLRAQLFAMRRIHGCQNECRNHSYSLPPGSDFALKVRLIGRCVNGLAVHLA
jgi:hypothetical protein